jgi:hypothetical protein
VNNSRRSTHASACSVGASRVTLEEGLSRYASLKFIEFFISLRSHARWIVEKQVKVGGNDGMGKGASLIL